MKPRPMDIPVRLIASAALAAALAGCATGADQGESNEATLPARANSEELSGPVIGVLEAPLSPRTGRFDAAVKADLKADLAIGARSDAPAASTLSSGEDGATEVATARYSAERVREIAAARAAAVGAR